MVSYVQLNSGTSYFQHSNILDKSAVHARECMFLGLPGIVLQMTSLQVCVYSISLSLFRSLSLALPLSLSLFGSSSVCLSVSFLISLPRSLSVYMPVFLSVSFFISSLSLFVSVSLSLVPSFFSKLVYILSHYLTMSAATKNLKVGPAEEVKSFTSAVIDGNSFNKIKSKLFWFLLDQLIKGRHAGL